jgi:phosphoserine phosphatase RsbU/P
VDAPSTTLTLCGRVAGRHFCWALDKPTLDIGRSQKSAIHIPDPTVSKEHAQIEVTAEGCLLRDLGSRNGTRVNGVTLKAAVALRPGDDVVIGHVAFTVGTGGEIPATPPRRTSPMNSSMVIPARDLLKRAAIHTDSHRLVDTLAAAGRLLVKPRSIEETCEAFLALVDQVVPSSRLVLMVRDESGGTPVVVAASPPSKATPPVLSQTILNAVIEEGASVLAVDAENDPRFQGRASIVGHALHALMAVPLLDDEKVLGLLYADTVDDSVVYQERDLEVLTLLANMLAVKIANARLLEAEEHRARLAQELATARLIQRGILPTGQPTLEGCDCWAFLDTCDEVGGDLYDVWQTPGGAVYLIVGDVSGKGMGAALLMASVLASARILYEDEPEPDELARRLNRMIHRSTDASLFVTAFIGRLDPATGQLRYVNAGHPRPLLAERDVRELPASALPLGVSPGAKYTSHTAQLGARELLLIYTDGIPEAEHEGVFFGTARLRDCLRARTGVESEAVAKSVLEDLNGFLGGHAAGDDATLLVIQLRNGAEAAGPQSRKAA